MADYETPFSGKRILLGVTGSIACYKIIDLASKLTQAGALVDVIMTEAAQQFVQPLSFRSVTGRSVHTTMWSLDEHVRHVKLGEEADLYVIAPATAHTMAKLAQGLADNLLTMSALTARCPLMLVPAMDGGMYMHPATQGNIATLSERGATMVGPAVGRMASGLSGAGRMCEPAEILSAIRIALSADGPLKGKQVVVTAGPTQEPLDPVRYLTNRSSGKQGIAMAQAALDLGAQVTLITGPLQVGVPAGVTHFPIRTALELHDAVLEHSAKADALLMVAAVSDFRPDVLADQKLKKSDFSEEGLVLPLARNPDILAAVKAKRAEHAKPTLVLGFAAETQDAVAYGRDKLLRKGLDFIAVNDVSQSDAGFATETNRLVLLDVDNDPVHLPLQSKAAAAAFIMARVAERLHQLQRAE